MIVRVAQRGLRHDNVSLARFHPRLGLHQLDRRQRAQFHPHGVLGQEVLREFLRLTLGGQILDAEYQFPVTLVDGKHRVQNRLYDALLGDLLSDLRLSHGGLVDRDAEILEQRVRERQFESIFEPGIIEGFKEPKIV